MRKKIILLCLLFLALLYVPVCFAQDNQDKQEEMEHAMVLAQAMKKSGINVDREYHLIYQELMRQEEKKKEKEYTIEADAYTRCMPSRRVEAMPGEVEIIEAFNSFDVETKVFGKMPIKFSLETNYIGIKENVSVPLPAHLTGLSAGVEVTLPFFTLDKTYMRIGINPSFYTDNWSFDTSAFRMPTYLYGIYLPNDKWTFVLGVAVIPDYKDEVWPIVGFIYKPNDRLIFNLTSKRPNITYNLNDKLSVFIEGSGTSSEFEVTRRAQKNVVLLYKELHAGAGLKYKFSNSVQASVIAGGVFNRKFEYRDKRGKVSVDNGMYAEFRLDTHF